MQGSMPMTKSRGELAEAVVEEVEGYSHGGGDFTSGMAVR